MNGTGVGQPANSSRLDLSHLAQSLLLPQPADSSRHDAAAAAAMVFRSALGPALAASVLDQAIRKHDRHRTGLISDTAFYDALVKAGFAPPIMAFAELIRPHCDASGAVRYPELMKLFSVDRVGPPVPPAGKKPPAPRVARGATPLLAPLENAAATAASKSQATMPFGTSAASAHADADAPEFDALGDGATAGAGALPNGDVDRPVAFPRLRNSVLSSRCSSRSAVEPTAVSGETGSAAAASLSSSSAPFSTLTGKVIDLRKRLMRRIYEKSLEARKTFRILDEEKRGVIPLDRFENALMKMFLLPETDRQALQELSKLIDKDTDGAISFAEFAAYLKESDLQIPRDVLEMQRLTLQKFSMGNAKFFTEVPADAIALAMASENPYSNSVPFALETDVEKMNMLIASRIDNKLNNLRAVFRSFDKDHDGRVTYDEFGRALKNLDPRLSNMEIAEYVSHLDKNCRGFIEYQDFVSSILGIDFIKPKAQRQGCHLTLLDWDVEAPKVGVPRESKEGSPSTGIKALLRRRSLGQIKDTKTNILRTRLNLVLNQLREQEEGAQRPKGAPHPSNPTAAAAAVAEMGEACLDVKPLSRLSESRSSSYREPLQALEPQLQKQQQQQQQHRHTPVPALAMGRVASAAAYHAIASARQSHHRTVEDVMRLHQLPPNVPLPAGPHTFRLSGHKLRRFGHVAARVHPPS